MGFSVWYVLFHGQPFYSAVEMAMLGLFAAAVLAVLAIAARRPVHPLRVIMFVTALFCLLYFKVYPEYYAMFLIVFLPAMAEDPAVLGCLAAAPVLIEVYSAWPNPVTPVVVAAALLVVAWRLWSRPYAFDRDLGDGARSKGYGTLADAWSARRTERKA
jgi:hypothetical protein